MNKKILLSMAMALFLLVAQVGTVFAQEPTTPPPTAEPTSAPNLVGTVQSITLETDATTNETTVLVTLLDETGATQTVRLDLTTAESLGLVSTDATTGVSTVNDTAVGTTVEIDPTTVIPDAGTGGDEEQTDHPVANALADFFGEMFGVDANAIMDYHDDGLGFGVIAQALWMTKQLDGDTTTFEAILDAKQNGDYSSVTLPDGTVPQNWGQFRKAVLDKSNKNNLGSIMSGHANDEDGTGNGNGNGNGNGHGNGNNGDHGPQNDKEKNPHKP